MPKPEEQAVEQATQDTPTPEPQTPETPPAPEEAVQKQDEGDKELVITEERIDYLSNRATSFDPDVSGPAKEELARIEAKLAELSEEGAKELPPALLPPEAQQEGEKPAEPEEGVAEEKPSEAEDKGEGEQKPKDEEQSPEEFFVTWKGERRAFRDQNRLLGHKNTGDLKRAYVKMQLQLEEAQAALREAHAQKPAPQKPPQPDTPAPPPPSSKQPQQPPVEEPKEPNPPEYPDVPDDMDDWTEDHRKQFFQYQRDISKFNSEMKEYTSYLKSRPTSLPETERERIDRMEREAAERKQQEEARVASEEYEQAEKRHWDNIRTFQAEHKEQFGTPVDIEQVHHKVHAWMDSVAASNGVRPPLTPKNYEDPQWATYLSQRQSLADRYLQGDQKVLQNAEGFTPPEGTDQYIRLSELSAARNDYVQHKRLGEGSTLHDAYLLQAREDGTLDQAVGEQKQQGVQQGHREVVDALSQAGDAARTLPPEASAPSRDEETPYGVSKSDIEWFSQCDPHKNLGYFERVMSDPVLKAKYHDIENKLVAYSNAHPMQ